MSFTAVALNGVDLLASRVAMTVADPAKEKDLTALPVKQPWAYAILNVGKDVENRRWQCGSRG
jgi:hypothetical protein